MALSLMNYKPVLIIAIVTLFSCNKNAKLENYPDPYAKAFWGKKVRTMIAYDPDSTREDSLRMERINFDSIGNIISRTGYMVNEKMEYNNLHYITRYKQSLDAPANYVITYDFKGDSLIQIWNSLKHRNWEYQNEDIIDTNKKYVKFKIENGKITDEIDLSLRQITLYSYDTDGRLISKEVYSMNNSNEKGDLQFKYLYVYNDSGINRFELYNNIELIETKFFSGDGLLDSTVHYFQNDHYTTKYRYVFF